MTGATTTKRPISAAISGIAIGLVLVVSMPSGFENTGAGVAHQEPSVVGHTGGGNYLESPGVVVEAEKIGDCTGWKPGHVGKLDFHRWIKRGARGLQRSGKERGGPVGHGHGDFVEMNLVE